jgi:hypothetical protein
MVRHEMRRFIFIILPIATVLTVAGVYLYRHPQVRDLFGVGGDSGVALPIKSVWKKSAPVKTTERSPAKTETVSSKVQPPEPTSSVDSTDQAAQKQPPAAENRVPNPILARTILQILRAKGLAEGISISVTDQRIGVAGFAKTEEARSQTLDVVEKAREARVVEASNFILQPN